MVITVAIPVTVFQATLTPTRTGGTASTRSVLVQVLVRGGVRLGLLCLDSTVWQSGRLPCASFKVPLAWLFDKASFLRVTLMATLIVYILHEKPFFDTVPNIRTAPLITNDNIAMFDTHPRLLSEICPATDQKLMCTLRGVRVRDITYTFLQITGKLPSTRQQMQELSKDGAQLAYPVFSSFKLQASTLGFGVMEPALDCVPSCPGRNRDCMTRNG